MASRYLHQRLDGSSLLLLAILTITTITRAQNAIDPSTSGACASTTNPCVATYHNDNAPDGVNPNEGTLSPAISTARNFGLLTGGTVTVDGLIYAQPLYPTGVAVDTTSCPTHQ
jgi:hypothetical protein